MMKLRTVSKFIGGAALAAAAVVAACALSLDPMAKHAVSTVSTDTLKLRTTVKSVNVHLLSDNLSLNDFRIASPAGFIAGDMLVVPSAEMNIAFSEVRNKPVHIKSIVMTNPRLVIEGDGTDLNLKRMVERIPRADHPVHMVIDKVTVRNATVVLRKLPGISGEVLVPVVTFTVDDIGADSPNGVVLKDAVIRLVGSLAVHASDSPQMPVAYRALLRGDIGQIVLGSITGHVGKLLSGLLGGAEGQGPMTDDTKPRGLFGLGNLLSRGHSGTTKPNE
jgi:hypothetical protein